jgi:hypothetical protein
MMLKRLPCKRFPLDATDACQAILAAEARQMDFTSLRENRSRRLALSLLVRVR